jgi:CubicO group peptidase (beta-lactamase class C family)
VTTIQDIYRWDRSLAKLSQDDPEFTSRYFMGGGLTDYSYGWEIVREKRDVGLPSYQIHTGGTPGFGSVIIRVPDKDAVVVMLFNSFWNGIKGETDFHRDLVRAVGRVE